MAMHSKKFQKVSARKTSLYQWLLEQVERLPGLTNDNITATAVAEISTELRERLLQIYQEAQEEVSDLTVNFSLRKEEEDER